MCYPEPEATVVAESGNYRVKVGQDIHGGEYDDPRRNGVAHVGTMVAQHPDYVLGDAEDAPLYAEALTAAREKGLAVAARYLRAFHGVTTVLPLYLLDHSGISISTRQSPFDPGGWDTSLVGILFDSPERRDETGVPAEQVEDALRAEVTEYDKYLTGEVYYAAVEQVDPQGDWTAVDAVHGLLGYEYAKEAARDLLSENAE